MRHGVHRRDHLTNIVEAGEGACGVQVRVVPGTIELHVSGHIILVSLVATVGGFNKAHDDWSCECRTGHGVLSVHERVTIYTFER